MERDRTLVTPLQPKTINYQSLLTQLETELNQIFLERSELIKLIITSILAKSNGFQGGKPGTGKTSLTKAITEAFEGRCFYYLMNSTTTPDEIIGAVDLAALTNGQGFKRDLAFGLVTANTAILDEGFKANSPCLNALLGIILDREYNNGGQIVRSPLNSLWVCSNELPTDEILAPFWDRLVIRYWVSDVSRSAKKTLMLRQAGVLKMPSVTVQITQHELATMQQQAISTPIDDAIVDALLNVTNELESEHGLIASTRKHNQLIDLIRCYAYASGDAEVEEEHLEVLEHTLWNQPQERSLVQKALKKFGNPLSTQAIAILEAAKQSFNAIKDKPIKNRGQWMKDVGTADMQLGEMEDKLDEMLLKGGKNKTKRYRKVEIAKREIAQMRSRIQEMIQKAYSLPLQ